MTRKSRVGYKKTALVTPHDEIPAIMALKFVSVFEITALSLTYWKFVSVCETTALSLTYCEKLISTRRLIISGFIRVNSVKRHGEKIVGQTDRQKMAKREA